MWKNVCLESQKLTLCNDNISIKAHDFQVIQVFIIHRKRHTNFYQQRHSFLDSTCAHNQSQIFPRETSQKVHIPGRFLSWIVAKLQVLFTCGCDLNMLAQWFAPPSPRDRRLTNCLNEGEDTDSVIDNEWL